MSSSFPTQSKTRDEGHFGDRVVRCFVDRPKNIDAMVRAAAVRIPDQDAIVASTGERIAYRELDAIVDRLAANLASLGVAPGDRVAILLGNRPEFIYLILAASRLGAISVPLNIREQTPELEYALHHCGARVLVHEGDLTSRLPQRAATPDLAHLFAVGGASSSVAFEPLLAPIDSTPTFAPAEEEDVAVILYTSGTTGRPKGAMLTHFNIVHSALHYQACMHLRSAERSLLAVPASHVTGLVAIIAAMLRCGGATIMMREFKARACLELMAKQRVTHTIMVPAMYNLCLLDPDFDRYDLSGFRIGGYGGAPMPEATIAALAQKLPNLLLINAYGATETTSPTTIMPTGKTAERPDSVGQVVPCGEVRIMDENAHEVARGESGEIWIGGPMVVQGYWNNREATAASFTGGFWHSGDIGSIDQDGFVRILDRKKDMINRGGYKIYSAEVENVLTHHPQVIECAIVPREDAVLGEKTHAFIVRRSPDCTIEDLRSFCAARLSDYKVPDFFTLQDEPLPRNANGKVMKRVLRERTGG